MCDHKNREKVKFAYKTTKGFRCRDCGVTIITSFKPTTREATIAQRTKEGLQTVYF